VVCPSSRPRVPESLPAPPVAATTITIADEGVRLRRVTRLLFALVWLVPGLIGGVLAWSAAHEAAVPLSLATALTWQVARWALWALWAQVILTLVQRLPLRVDRLGLWLRVHVATWLGVVLVNLLLVSWLDWQFAPWAANVARFSDAMRQTSQRNVDFDVIMYWALLGAAYMIEYVRRYRERDRAALALEQRLAHQQLEALRMQLNPHFLFNALNSVSELMEADVRRAQRALSAVSDLLRLSLRSATQPTIPLWQELELVELYLHVARVRFGDGLRTDIEIDPSVVDAVVPSFVLQPLIENALNHGLQPGGTGQTVLVKAQCIDDMLQLRVTDNGRGLAGRLTDSGRFLAARPSVHGLGIGLTNTRSRLALLYGDRYAFRMFNGPTGGCTVEIRLPLRA
jgi:two-component system LytT family sensor kinase